MGVSYGLKQGQSRLFHELPSGLNMEVIVQKGVVVDEKKQRIENPPLVFVHGSYHAAWCWAEHWLPFFSAYGYDCYAVSLLGQVLSLTHIHFHGLIDFFLSHNFFLMRCQFALIFNIVEMCNSPSIN